MNANVTQMMVVVAGTCAKQSQKRSVRKEIKPRSHANCVSSFACVFVCCVFTGKMPPVMPNANDSASPSGVAPLLRMASAGVTIRRLNGSTRFLRDHDTFSSSTSNTGGARPLLVRRSGLLTALDVLAVFCVTGVPSSPPGPCAISMTTFGGEESGDEEAASLRGVVEIITALGWEQRRGEERRGEARRGEKGSI